MKVMGSIQDWWVSGKALLEEGIAQWGLIALVFLVAFSAFGLGRLSALEEAKAPIQIENAAVSSNPPSIPAGGYLVASKTGTTYYFPWCSGAARISSASQIWFPSEAAAQKAGYRAAKNCKGLE